MRTKIMKKVKLRMDKNQSECICIQGSIKISKKILKMKIKKKKLLREFKDSGNIAWFLSTKLLSLPVFLNFRSHNKN